MFQSINYWCKASTFLVLSLLGVSLSSIAEQIVKPVPAYELTTLTDQLVTPWSLAFLPSGEILIAEKIGALRIFDGKKLSAPLKGVPKALVRSQGGFQDLVLHPDYQQNGWVYLSFAWGDKGANGTRLVRGRIVQGAFVDQEVLFTAEPLKNTPVHYGARLAFLPDHSLVMGVGDGFDFREAAQKTNSLLGKMVRLQDDGSIPKDNPFIANKDYHPAIYTMGHRNPQGMAFDSVRGKLFSNEHGPQGGDEINIITAGNNYGWPIITYGRDYSGASITPFTEYEGMQQPLVNWTPSIAPSSLAVYNAKLFPAFEGDLLSSALKAKEVRWVQMQGDKPGAEVSLFKELNERIRAVYVGPEGALYLLTDGDKGKLIKVTPARAG